MLGWKRLRRRARVRGRDHEAVSNWDSRPPCQMRELRALAEADGPYAPPGDFLEGDEHQAVRWHPTRPPRIANRATARPTDRISCDRPGAVIHRRSGIGAQPVRGRRFARLPAPLPLQRARLSFGHVPSRGACGLSQGRRGGNCEIIAFEGLGSRICGWRCDLGPSVPASVVRTSDVTAHMLSSGPAGPVCAGERSPNFRCDGAHAEFGPGWARLCRRA